MEPGAAGRRLTILLVSVLVLLAAIVKGFYWDLATNLYYMMDTDQYSYLSAGIIVAALTLALTARDAGGGEGLSIGRLLLYGFLLSVSATSYLLARRDLEYAIQYEMLSLILLVITVYMAVFEPREPRHVIPVLGLLLLVPPPVSWIDYVSNQAGIVVAILTSALTGVEYYEGPTGIILEVPTPFGVEEFAVTTACTGIISMSSSLAVTPLLAYIAASARASASRRLLTVIVAALAGLLVAFLGNLARVVVLVETAEAFGMDYALLVFHYTPSLIYAPLAVVVGLWIAKRMLGREGLLPATRQPWAPGMARLAAATILLIAFFTGLTVAVAENGSSLKPVEPVDYQALYDDPARIVYAPINATIEASKDMASLKDLLGASKVVMVRVSWQGQEFTGYIELVESLSRLHTWQMCLVAQGFGISDAWTVEDGGTKVYVVEYGTASVKRMLAYTIIQLPVDFGGRVEDVYIRASLIVQDEAGLSQAVRLLRLISGEPQTPAPAEGPDPLGVLVLLDYSLFILLLLYISLLSLDKSILARVIARAKKFYPRR